MSADRLWHPYLRLCRLIRGILTTRWDTDTWKQVKPELENAIRERSRVARARWFN
jgi:hypothetical protein